MKKYIVLSIVLTLVMAAISIVPTSTAHTEADPQVVTLWAGQNIDAGTVSVWNDGDNIYVTFETTGEWEMTETHLYVGNTDPNDLTTAPGQFPYSGETEYVIPLSEICEYEMELNKKGNPTGKMIPISGTSGVDSDDSVYIAAHADVRKLDSIEWTELLTNGGFETPAIASGWTIVPDASLPGWTTAPNVPDTYGDPEGLELQRNLLVTAYEGDQYAELDAYYPIILTQTVTACESGEYRLSYAYAPRPTVADNQLNVIFGDYEADHSGSGVGGSSWTYIEELVTGSTSGTVDLVFTETGLDDQLGMFLDDVSLECKVYNYIYESAWGEGTDFDHPNWAMYFEYDIQGWTYLDTITVSSDGTTASIESLTAGEEYLFKVSGTYKYGNWDGGVYADAEWADRGTGDDPLGYTGWIKGDTEYSTDYGLDLYFIDGGSDISLDWGDYSASHEYSCYYTPSASSLGMKIWDSYHGDNVGSLTVLIYEWA